MKSALKAYSLIEITVAMVVSGIGLSIVIVAYNYLQKDAMQLINSNEQQVQNELTLAQFEYDLALSDYAMYNGNELELSGNRETIRYETDPLTRVNETNNVDGIKSTIYVSQVESGDDDLVDKITIVSNHSSGMHERDISIAYPYFTLRKQLP